MRVGARGAVLASVALACSILVSRSVEAQEHAAHDMSAAAPSWIFMQDGVAWLIVHAQGSPRGKTELKAPNWWRGMAQRRVNGRQLTFAAMLSLAPAPVGDEGFSPIFQAGVPY